MNWAKDSIGQGSQVIILDSFRENCLNVEIVKVTYQDYKDPTMYSHLQVLENIS